MTKNDADEILYSSASGNLVAIIGAKSAFSVTRLLPRLTNNRIPH